jgi:uncharacterized protein (DUF697 family)
MSEHELLALKTIRRYMWWSAGAGLVPFPVVDLVAMSGAQLKMLAEISKIYGIPFERSRVQAIVGSLIGYVLPHTFSVGLFGSLLKAIPGVGVLVGSPSQALFAAAYAWALGRVFIQHFESGGTFLNFDPEAVREHFRAQFEEGQRMAANRNNGEHGAQA